MDNLLVRNPGKAFGVHAGGVCAIRHRSLTSQAIKAVFWRHIRPWKITPAVHVCSAPQVDDVWV